MLSNAEAFAFFRHLLNYTPGKADAVRLREDTFLDYDLCDSALECHRTHLRLDDTYVRVMTLKEPPSHTFPHLFQALYEIPSNLILKASTGKRCRSPQFRPRRQCRTGYRADRR